MTTLTDRPLADEARLQALVGKAVGDLGATLSTAMISLDDRLLGSNTEESFQELKREVGPFAKQLFGDAEVRFERDEDPRRRLNVHLKTSAAVDLRKTLDRLQLN